MTMKRHDHFTNNDSSRLDPSSRATRLAEFTRAKYQKYNKTGLECFACHCKYSTNRQSAWIDNETHEY
jgi:hypothetical protein